MRHAVLRRMAPLWAVLVAAILAVGVAGYDAHRRADDRRAVELALCERMNRSNEVIIRFLAESCEGTLTPARAEFYRQAIEGLAPIDCAALPREGG